MLPLIPSLITGGASLLGSMFSSDQSAKNTQMQIQGQQAMQKESEQFNADQAQITRDYQTSMSNTAYQRASKDMTSAGLNPMMMFGSGSAASSPSGATASISTPTMPYPQTKSALGSLGDAAAKAVSTAVEMKSFERMTQEIANLKATQALTGAQAITEAQRPGLVSAQEKATIAQKEKSEADAAETRVDTNIKGPAAVEAAGVLDLPDSVVRNVGKVKYGAGTVSDVVTPIVNSALRLKGMGVLRRAFDAQEAAHAVRGY